MNRSKLLAGLPLLAAAAATSLLVGCGSNWRMHQEMAMTSKPSTADAPDWVRGQMPMADDRVYFIGRSHTPDHHREYHQSSDRHKTVNTRVGFTVMDERDAVQSARNDVYDQIRQRLSPRSLGTTAQTISAIVDVGNCIDCGDPLPKSSRMPVQAPCNEPCMRSAMTTWPNSASNDAGRCSTVDRCWGCADKKLSCGGSVRVKADCGGCGDGHAFVATRSPGSTGPGVRFVLDDAPGYPWHPPQKPDYGHIQDYDLSYVNLGIDSVMPAMLANVTEEQIYFEKWHVSEGQDQFGRPLATGRDEWQSYKCWMLCSIPRSEYEMLVGEFRGQYAMVLGEALKRESGDRERRIEWEMHLQEQGMNDHGDDGDAEVYNYYHKTR